MAAGGNGGISVSAAKTGSCHGEEDNDVKPKSGGNNES